MKTIQTSYALSDVELLLQPAQITPTDVAEKEQLIQSGRRHYSEMLSTEAAPTAAYLDIYREAMAQNSERTASAAISLAKGIAQAIDGPVILVSLVRAGLPIGVLLTRALRHRGREAMHYGVSIIRDRGIDRIAMRTIIQRHGTRNLIFVDGWTGKGAIAQELAKAWPDARLATLADIGGFAWMAPTRDDWLIPSGILGGVVSGLVSRSVLTPEIELSGGYHGAMELTDLATHDLSNAFVDDIWEAMLRKEASGAEPATPTSTDQRLRLRQRVRSGLGQIMKTENVQNRNRIKPGIAEATRAILRRRPHRVYLAAEDDPNLTAIRHLIARDGIDYVVDRRATFPYRALTVIERTSGAQE